MGRWLVLSWKINTGWFSALIIEVATPPPHFGWVPTPPPLPPLPLVPFLPSIPAHNPDALSTRRRLPDHHPGRHRRRLLVCPGFSICLQVHTLFFFRSIHSTCILPIHVIPPCNESGFLALVKANFRVIFFVCLPGTRYLKARGWWQ